MTVREKETSVRNLDEIQEEEAGPRPSRAGALVLASLGGACIVFAAAALMRSPIKTKVVNHDPLGDLVAKAHPAGAAAPAPEGVGGDVTFPGVLSDAKRPTTALEAVREQQAQAQAQAQAAAHPGADLPFQLPPGAPSTPPSAADRLPVVPLPAQNILEGNQGPAPTTDTLATMAKHASRDDAAESATAGAPGGYQLQVSSFKTSAEAEAFAAALRRRGHRSYVEAAEVKGRGTWYRVKVGPFKYKHAAVIYRQDFEAKERMVTFIVDPPKTTAVVRPTLAADDE